MKVAFNESLKWERSKQGTNFEAWKVLPINFATVGPSSHADKQRISSYS